MPSAYRDARGSRDTVWRTPTVSIILGILKNPAQIFAQLRSVVSTARKQACNILQTLAAPPTHIKLGVIGSPTAWELPQI